MKDRFTTIYRDIHNLIPNRIHLKKTEVFK